MVDIIPTEIAEQVSQAVTVIKRYIKTLLAIHLFGSAVDGGLKPNSDIDLLVTVTDKIDMQTRKALLSDLLKVSASINDTTGRRPLEITVILYDEVIPWCHPAKRELQFGEWLRSDILAGIVEPAMLDHDLAILLTKVRQYSIPILGATADSLLQAIPSKDFLQALADTVKQWHTKVDWQGDERNIVLALARVWYSVETGEVAPKDTAATWLLQRLPTIYQPILYEAKQAYLGNALENILKDDKRMAEFVYYAKASIEALLKCKK